MDKDKVSAIIKDMFSALLPNADVEVVDLSAKLPSAEMRSASLEVSGDTAADLEAMALEEGREFFGPGPELHAEDGWRAVRTAGEWRTRITVCAHGPLAKPEAEPELTNTVWRPAPECEVEHEFGAEGWRPGKNGGPHEHQWVTQSEAKELLREPEPSKPMDRPPWEQNAPQ